MGAWAAEQHPSTRQQIEELTAKAQNWIDIIQGHLDAAKDQFHADAVKNTQLQKWEEKWQPYKELLGTVIEKAVQLFVIENMPPSKQKNELHTIHNDMKHLMPNDKDLALLDQEIDKIFTEKQEAPQKPTSSEQPQAKPTAPTTKIPVAGFDVPLSKKNDNQRENPLTDQLIEAGVNNEFEYYNMPTITRIESPHGGFRALHRIGNYVDEDFLAQYFINTLFQYYTTQITGYNPNWANFYHKNPEDLSYFDKLVNNLESGKLSHLIKYLTRIEDFDFNNPRHMRKLDFYLSWQLEELLLNAFEKFKQNKLLRALGIAYQRQKIVLEKLQQLASGMDDKFQQLLYKYDLFTNDLQTIIYYFIEEAYYQLRKRLEDKLKTEEELSDVGNFLSNLQPQFIKRYPYYQTIIMNLEKFQQPVRGQFEWGGKMYTID